MSTTLESWINQKAEERGWSLREIAGHVGVSHTAIVTLANGQSNLSPRLGVKLANLFNESPVYVFRLGGLLPPGPEEAPSIREAMQLLDQLSDEQLDIVLTQMRALADKNRQTAAANGRRLATHSP